MNRKGMSMKLRQRRIAKKIREETRFEGIWFALCLAFIFTRHLLLVHLKEGDFLRSFTGVFIARDY